MRQVAHGVVEGIMVASAAVLAAVAIVALCASVVVAQDAPKLSEVQILKAQVFALRAQNLGLQKQSVESQIKQAEDALTKERGELEAEFVKTMKCAAGWDWPTMACAKPPEKPEPVKK